MSSRLGALLVTRQLPIISELGDRCFRWEHATPCLGNMALPDELAGCTWPSWPSGSAEAPSWHCMGNTHTLQHTPTLPRKSAETRNHSSRRSMGLMMEPVGVMRQPSLLAATRLQIKLLIVSFNVAGFCHHEGPLLLLEYLPSNSKDLPGLPRQSSLRILKLKTASSEPDTGTAETRHHNLRPCFKLLSPGRQGSTPVIPCMYPTKYLECAARQNLPATPAKTNWKTAASAARPPDRHCRNEANALHACKSSAEGFPVATLSRQSLACSHPGRFPPGWS